MEPGGSLGKRWFAIRLKDTRNRGVSPLVAALRASSVFVPYYFQDIRGLLPESDLVTCLLILPVIAILCGETLFMVFHPQKRGLLDVLFGTLVEKASSKGHERIRNFTARPILVSSGNFQDRCRLRVT